MINFLKKLLLGKHYDVKKRFRNGTPKLIPQTEKELLLKSLVSKLNLTPEEANRMLLKTLKDDTDTSVNILKSLSEKHKKGVFDNTPQQDINDAIQGIKLFNEGDKNARD